MGDALSFVTVVRFFLKTEGESEEFFSEGLFVLVWSLLGFSWVLADDFHFASFLVRNWPQVVGDDDGVWVLVVGDKVDFTGWVALLELSWGDGNHELSLWGKTDGGTEWSLNDDVALETRLVLFADKWSFVGKTGVGFPGVDGVNLSNDLRVAGTIFLNNLDGSTE